MLLKKLLLEKKKAKSMDVLAHLSQREIKLVDQFIEQRKHLKVIHEEDEVNLIKDTKAFVSTFLNTIPHQDDQKKLFLFIYNEIIENNDNNFTGDVKISGSQQAIEFLWDSRENKVTVALRKKGCLAWLCCQSCSVSHDFDDQQTSGNFEPIPPKPQRMNERELQDKLKEAEV